MATRIYALAFSAEPHRGSEPGVGYEFARALAQLSLRDDVSIRFYTRSHRLQMIANALAEHVPHHRLELVPIHIPERAARLLQGAWVRLPYVMWQKKAVDAIAKHVALAPTHDSIVIHHITFATMALPTFEWRIADAYANRVRFVYGPAGSALMELCKDPSLAERIAHATRSHVAKKNLACVDLAVCQTANLVPILKTTGAKEVIVSPNCVVDPPPETKDVPRDLKKIVCVGNLIPLKRPWLALETFSLLDDKELRLVFVGDGPERAKLVKKAAELGVSDRVDFVGRVPRAEALRHTASAAVLLHCALSEGAPWVVAEAQTLGTPPIAPPKTGADSIIGLGGIGVVAASDTPRDMAGAVEEALTLNHRSTSMWSRTRLPALLRDWYQLTPRDAE